MPECSICAKGEETARTINELFERKTPVREIQAQTGFNKSTADRHKHGDCRFSFSKYKAAKVKSRSVVNLDGRQVVSWPNGNFTVWGQPICAQELGSNDLLIRVSYEESDMRAIGNPRALPATLDLLEKLFDVALSEDAKRFPKLVVPS